MLNVGAAGRIWTADLILTKSKSVFLGGPHSSLLIPFDLKSYQKQQIWQIFGTRSSLLIPPDPPFVPQMFPKRSQFLPFVPTDWCIGAFSCIWKMYMWNIWYFVVFYALGKILLQSDYWEFHLQSHMPNMRFVPKCSQSCIKNIPITLSIVNSK